jgi:ABC-type antimicrobial peptide transport system permease subunit
MPSFRSIPVRNLVFHWRDNLAVLLGVAVGAAVLTGALFVGDSLRGSLRARAERQLNGVEAAWVGPRLIPEGVAERLPGDVTPALMLQASVEAEGKDHTRERLTRVTIFGLTASGADRFGLPRTENWGKAAGIAVVSRWTADRLGVRSGERLELSVQRFSNVPRSSFLGHRNADDVTETVRVTVAAVLDPAAAANDFSLSPNPAPPANVFVPLGFLQQRLQQAGKVNALLASGADATALNTTLATALKPVDAGLRVTPHVRKGYTSVEAEQLVLDPVAAAAAEATARDLGARSERTVVYLANWISDGTRRIPYSVVAGLNPKAAPPLGPFLPPGERELRDDEIVLADWEESPLKATPIGTPITLTFFKPELEAGPEETTATFRLAGRIPLAGVAADPDLTPPFPGITDKLAIGDWNPPFPFDKTRIKPRDENERYWDKHRATPKAYITLAAAERFFGSRFGVVTSVRLAHTQPGGGAVGADQLTTALQNHLDPAKLGIAFDSTRERLLAASGGSNDFAGLFLAFSVFLIVSALLLVGLLFRLNVERRAKEVGLLLASGYSFGQVRRLLLAEGALVAVFGSLVGLAAAVWYSRLLLVMLTRLWPDESVRTFLAPHAAPASFATGFAGTVIMSGLAILFALRGLTRVSTPALLRGVAEVPEPAGGGTPPRVRAYLWPAGLAVLGLIGLGLGVGQQNPDYRAMSFFGGGGVLLAGGVLAVRYWLRAESRGLPAARGAWGLLGLGRRNAARFRGRSLLTVALLAAATFLLVAVESFRRRPDHDFEGKGGGSGGFNLLAEASVPVFQPFDRDPGRGDLLDALQENYQREGASGAALKDKLNAAEATLDGLRDVIPLRLRGGDDASCLNLYQANRPRVVGVPDALIDRGGFRFAQTEATSAEERANPWLLLKKSRPDGAVPVFVEQNSAMWMLKKGVGDAIDLADETGSPVRGRIVGTLQDSVFQSELLVPDADYRRLYPRDEGFRLFLIDTAAGGEAAVGRVLESGLRSNGVVVTPARDRVTVYQAVIGTYLTTFQLLGGLGLLLGILGVAVVVLRGVWERTGELALLRAFGYTTRAVRVLVVGENLLLLALGLGLGLVTALVSVAPHVALGGSVPWAGIAVMAVGVTAVGVSVVLAATAGATSTPLVPALRKD